MASLAEIRAKLKEQESRTSGNSSGGGDNAIYPFWNIKEGESATLRFLPDGDESNTFFWKERLMIKLPFAGVKGETDSRPVQVQIPCMEMYGETCDILNEVRGWFKDPSLEDMGRKYWKKRSYIFQGFVTDNPLTDDTQPENPIRRFIIGPQIFQIIKAALMDPDMEELPTDYTAGVDFRLNKTSKGGYADYSTSNWARRDRPLGDAEMKGIETNNLWNLSDFLPKKPGDIEVKVMKEMFEASVDGEAYDPDRFGQYFRPAGMSARTGDPNKSSNNGTATSMTAEAAPVAAPVAEATPEATPVAEVTPTPTAEAAPAEGNAQDILAMIRSRQAT
ncbi:MAG: hypothetical protein CMN33_02585 [Saprospirales bacterium]|nr:hypothetical protein [Saprospirales bacterium]|tara:strand:+ start:2884 stop:3885 length:1002 start_codon:yes stop_codon:yes gene_type:complete